MLKDAGGGYAPSIADVNGVFFGEGDLRINIGMSTCGLAAGAGAVYDRLMEEVRKRNLEVKIVKVGCIGSCYAEPLMEIIGKGHPGVIYSNVTPEKVQGILDSYLKGNIAKAYAVRMTDDTFDGRGEIPVIEELDFFKYQIRDAIKNCGIIDPESIEEYIMSGGYRALVRALCELTPEQVIEEVLKSGLRGRGGAGFPTGLKWRLTRRAPGDKKYAICNGDEGDPGAFMNRLNVEGDPHKILEGLIIAAYAIGADEGYVFVRAEKALMAERMSVAIRHAEGYGLLGEDILGSGFSLRLRTVLSAGAFVCGEETGMIAAIEGRRAMPRPRPPFPATNGLWGKPTVINNVETLAHVPTIIAEGPREFAKIGTDKSKGTKVFCLAGKIQRGGAVEVPLGTTLKRLVFDIGGGPPGGKRIKAVQTGGPSGGCLPEEHLDLPLDYETLQEAGSIMGSGGVIVIDEDTCIVDLAKYFLTFTTAESCGKCTPCRIGLKLMKDVLTRITSGEGEIEDLDLLKTMAETVADTALCALGRTAPNPILTTLKHFGEEYGAHIREKRCPAHVCTDLMKVYTVNPNACRACGICVDECPSKAITIKDLDAGRTAVIDENDCIRCGRCISVCPFNAIRGEW